MLALPINVHVSRLDPVKPFTKFIENFSNDVNFPSEIKDKNLKEIQEYNIVRQNAISVTENSEIGTQYFLRYHYHMSSIAKKISGYESELKLAFNWADPFRTKKNFTQNSFYFDWACVLWNFAATESIKGAKIDRNNDEGIKLASKHFQQASGIIEFIKSEISPHLSGPILSGLTTEGLQLSSQLMLAQAQLCFYEKCIRDKKSGNSNMKSNIIAKLAAQTALFYENSSKACATGCLPGVLDASWPNLINFQQNLFKGAAEYWQSQAVKEIALQSGSGFGEEIVRLSKAEAWLVAALKLSEKGSSSVLASSAEVLIRTVKTSKASAERDNQTVYMEFIPTMEAVGSVSPVSMVKPSSFPEYQSVETKFFKEIVSKEIRAMTNSLKERIDSLVTSNVNNANSATNEARMTLSSVGLPGTVESYKEDGQLPESIWQNIQRAKNLGGMPELKNKFDELESISNRALSTMQDIDNSILKEENNDISFHNRFPQWSGVSTAILNSDIKNNIIRFRDAYNTARSSDNIITETMNDNNFLEAMAILSKSRNEINDSFNRTKPLIDFEDDLNGITSPVIDTTQLENYLNQLSSLIEIREKFVADISYMTTIDISEIALKGQPSIDEFFHNCEAISADIYHTMDDQSNLLSIIIQLNEVFQKGKEHDPQTIEREKLVTNIEQSISKCFNLNIQLNAGITFYSNLQSRLSTLLQNSDDLAYTQRLARQDYELSITTKSNQEVQDHEYAKNIYSEMNNLNIAPPYNNNPPSIQFKNPNSNNNGNLHSNEGNLSTDYPRSPSSNNQVPPPFQPSRVPVVQPPIVPPKYSSQTSSNSLQYQQQFPTTGYQNSPNQHVPQYEYNSYQHAISQQNQTNQQHQQYQQYQNQSPSTGYQPQSVYQSWDQQQSPPGQQVPNAHQPQHQQYQNQVASTGSQHQFQGPPTGYQQQNYQQAPVRDHQQQQQQAPVSFVNIEGKAQRLSEMGFSIDQCMGALRANNNDEESAIISLLGGQVDPALLQQQQQQQRQIQQHGYNPQGQGQPLVQQQPPVLPEKAVEKKSTGFFSKWGK